MTRAAYEQLLTLLRHAVNDNPHDLQVRRLAKGLVKALTKWLRLTEPRDSVQARNALPQVTAPLARVNASLASTPQDAVDDAKSL